MKKIAIRVNAGNTTGMGHLMESLALAGDLESKGGQAFFMINDYAPAKSILNNAGISYEVIKHASMEADEVDEVVKILQRHECKLLLLDIPGSDSLCSALYKCFSPLVVILDDSRNRPVDADLVVNFNIAQDSDFYRNLETNRTSYYIGPKYVLMPRRLNEAWQNSKIITAECRNIFVNQGGSDPFGLTIKILKELLLFKIRAKTTVVIGPAVLDEHKNQIKKMEPLLPEHFTLEWEVKQDRIYRLIQDTDLAITAAGNTLYELAVHGVPSMIICHHEEHDKVARQFANRGAAVNLGIGSDLADGLIGKEVMRLMIDEEARSLMSRNMKHITDGLGCERVIDRILKLC